MKFHIVREGETIKDIMFLYSVNEDELKEDNRHIRKWDRLVPGTKLKISVITKSDDEDIMQMEPFVEDYYPKEVKLDEENEVINETVLNEKNDSITTEEVVVEANVLEPVEDNLKEEIMKTDDEAVKQINNEVRNEPNYNIVRKQRYIYYPYYVYYPIYMNNMYPYYVNRNRFR